MSQCTIKRASLLTKLVWINQIIHRYLIFNDMNVLTNDSECFSAILDDSRWFFWILLTNAALEGSESISKYFAESSWFPTWSKNIFLLAIDSESILSTENHWFLQWTAPVSKKTTKKIDEFGRESREPIQDQRRISRNRAESTGINRTRAAQCAQRSERSRCVLLSLNSIIFFS